MSEQPPLALAPLFAAVEQALTGNRESLNQADLINGNHGDHMIAVFHLAARAAEEKQAAPLAEAMAYAADLLGEQPDNGSARVYSSGLAQLAFQFRKYDLGLDDFVGYVRQALRDNKEEVERGGETRANEVLKALLAALAGWKQVEAGNPPADSALDMGFLFDLGVAYMQAKQRRQRRPRPGAGGCRRFSQPALLSTTPPSVGQAGYCSPAGSDAPGIVRRLAEREFFFFLGYFLLRLAVEDLHVQGNHLGIVRAPLPFANAVGVQSTLQVNQAAFTQVFLAFFAHIPPGFDVEPIGGFFEFAIFALPAPVNRNAKIGHLFTGRCIAGFGISS